MEVDCKHKLLISKSFFVVIDMMERSEKPTLPSLCTLCAKTRGLQRDVVYLG